MRRIAIVGGAFDPIHNDHIKLGYGAMYMGLVDDVTYSPCYRHKFAKDMVPGFATYVATPVGIYAGAKLANRLIWGKQKSKPKRESLSYEELIEFIEKMWATPVT